MSKTRYFIAIFAMLIIAATETRAQYAGTISYQGTLRYAFSGGTIVRDKVVTSTTNEQKHEFWCNIEEGDIISLLGRKEGGIDSLKTILIEVTFEKRANGGFEEHVPKKRIINHNGEASLKMRIPDDTDRIHAIIRYSTRRYDRTTPGGWVGKTLRCSVYWVVKKKVIPPEEDVNGTECDCCKEQPLVDSKIRINDLYGEVSIRHNWSEDFDYEYVDFNTIVYECDRIKTEKDSEAILALWDNSSFTLKPETVTIIMSDDYTPGPLLRIAGGIWGNIVKIYEGKTIDFEMQHEVAGIYGTIFACEERDGKPSFYLFAGKADVTNKITKKVTVAKPGQVISVKADGKTVVETFDIEKEAKRWGIPMDEIRNHYTANPPMTTSFTEKRYNVKRALVKYKVTRGNQQGSMAKLFDQSGFMERRELVMDTETILQLTQGSQSYHLNRNAKTYKAVADAELNILDMSTPLMKRLNLKKKGTTTILGRSCTVYANSTTEFSVWKGVVLRKVAKEGNATTVTQAISVDLSPTIEKRYFIVPKEYKRVKQ